MICAFLSLRNRSNSDFIRVKVNDLLRNVNTYRTTTCTAYLFFNNFTDICVIHFITCKFAILGNCWSFWCYQKSLMCRDMSHTTLLLDCVVLNCFLKTAIFSLLINGAVAWWDYIALVIDKWVLSTGGIIRTGKNWSAQRKTCTGATLSATNLTRSVQELKPVFRDKVLSTNSLSHVTK